MKKKQKKELVTCIVGQSSMFDYGVYSVDVQWVGEFDDMKRGTWRTFPREMYTPFSLRTAEDVVKLVRLPFGAEVGTKRIKKKRKKRIILLVS